MSVSDPSSRGDVTASCKDESDAYEQFFETLKDIAVTPFLSGVVQGIVSVAVQRRREKRAERKKAADVEAAAKALAAAIQ